MSETSLQNAYDRIEELELKLESANERINQLKEELMDAKNKYAALVADVALYEDRGERIKRLEEGLERLFNLPNDCFCELSNSSLDAWKNAHELLEAKEAKP